MPCCHTCKTTQSLQQQFCGFWFCFHCLPRAIQLGAAYWLRLYHALYPWR